MQLAKCMTTRAGALDRMTSSATVSTLLNLEPPLGLERGEVSKVQSAVRSSSAGAATLPHPQSASAKACDR
eukprot:15437147-Alexandrium_andersonii.AAC.1